MKDPHLLVKRWALYCLEDFLFADISSDQLLQPCPDLAWESLDSKLFIQRYTKPAPTIGDKYRNNAGKLAAACLIQIHQKQPTDSIRDTWYESPRIQVICVVYAACP